VSENKRRRTQEKMVSLLHVKDLKIKIVLIFATFKKRTTGAIIAFH